MLRNIIWRISRKYAENFLPVNNSQNYFYFESTIFIQRFKIKILKQHERRGFKDFFFDQSKLAELDQKP